MNKPDQEPRYRAPALDKGLDILELLAQQPKGMTRAEIVKSMGRNPSEIYRMLERLVAREYVSRSSEGDRYALTMKLFLLGSQHPPLRRLVAQAMPLMDVFAIATQQSVHLVAQDRGIAVVVAQASGRANWEFRLRVGAQLDFLNTSSGQTLLAFQSPERRAEILSSPPNTMPDDFARVEAALDAIVAQGYRVADSRQLRGVQDISVPVLSPSGDAVAVLTCPFIKRLDRDDGVDTTTVLNALLAVAADLSIH